MANRPILATILFWLAVGLIQLYLHVSCGFGAGWDEESHQMIVDCRYDAQIYSDWVNFLAILGYSIWAVTTITKLKRTEAE